MVKIPSPTPTTTPHAQAKGAPAKKTPKLPSPTPTTQPLSVKKAAPAKKTAKPKDMGAIGPYGNSKHGK